MQSDVVRGVSGARHFKNNGTASNSTLFDINETYHNKTILDDLGYDFIWIKSSERFDRED